MKVKELMTREVGFCTHLDKLAQAALMMREKDCGIVPIVDQNLKVIGIITDRDVCLAVAAHGQKAAGVLTQDFIGGKVISCAENDKITDILKKMRKNQIKRLPVTSQDGKLIGIISLADIVQNTDGKSVRREILKAIKSISRPRPILLHEIE